MNLSSEYSHKSIRLCTTLEFASSSEIIERDSLAGQILISPQSRSNLRFTSLENFRAKPRRCSWHGWIPPFGPVNHCHRIDVWSRWLLAFRQPTSCDPNAYLFTHVCKRGPESPGSRNCGIRPTRLVANDTINRDVPRSPPRICACAAWARQVNRGCCVSNVINTEETVGAIEIMKHGQTEFPMEMFDRVWPIPSRNYLDGILVGRTDH